MDKDNGEWSIHQGTKEEILWLDSQLEEFDKKQVSFFDKQVTVFKNYFIKNNDNMIIAGIKSWSYLQNILFIEVLFIHAKLPA